MLKVLSNILCDLDPKVKVKGQKAGICDGVPSTSALVFFSFLGGQHSLLTHVPLSIHTVLLEKIIENFNELSVKIIVYYIKLKVNIFLNFCQMI